MTVVKQQKAEINGQPVSLEFGSWAKQAHGSVLYRSGGLALLATVCADKQPKEGQDFFPLTVDYREKFYAAGRIPGGYFKRENRPAEHETLMSRLIDRPCRPLFPEGYLCEVQLLVGLLSADMGIGVEGHAITAASAALMNSDIPWDGPIAGLLLGRVDGQYLIDAGSAAMERSDLNLLVAGSREAITMIEGDAKEYSNDEMLEALDFAHKALVSKLDIQEELARSIGIKKREVALSLPDEAFVQELHQYAYEKMQAANRTTGKLEREAAVEAVYEQTTQHFQQKLSDAVAGGRGAGEGGDKGGAESGSAENAAGDSGAEESEYLSRNLAKIGSVLHEIEYLAVRALIFEEERRADGRKPQDIRSISVEIDPLPGAHGSAVFTRGQTQSLGVVTLGTRLDNQRYETLEGQKTKSFMLHYNFPPFSTGEVKRAGGPGRREIGHGNLAWRALKHVLPDEREFPYVIRVVSEILESNGSSSMASVCSGSLALMAAGVPIRRAVSGIAMGLMTSDKGEAAILSDIAGIEDHFGDMDFKLAGTEKGITAFQLDLKVKGISLDILRRAMEQAEKGRLHILEEMKRGISDPRPELQDNAPRIITLQIDTDRIGELIGPGGRIIKTIIEKTGAEVNVEDDGKVTISSASRESNESAKKMVEDIFRELQAGDSYRGVVKRIVDFGAFVELYPGKEGLLHISKMSHQRVNAVTDLFKEGDEVSVVVVQIDRMGRVDLVHQDLHDSPDYVASSREDGHRGGGGNRPPRGEERYQRNDRGRHHDGGDRHGGDRRGRREQRRPAPRGGGRYR